MTREELLKMSKKDLVPQKLLSGEAHAGQQDREKRNKIIELTMAHMGQ